jgi:hypothetical protein
MGLWKNIRKWWEKLSSFTRFEIRDGFKINFWHDLWCGEVALKVAFPVLYGLASAKEPLLRLIWSFWRLQPLERKLF